ncbi:hypothetical protein [Acuticoccus kandeliae]|uniref:hypothetical protein n=1 Tax=Acuticoccus kandeliae TaxID=2073160 RepID=UPI0013001DBE|nr:hypothetical protein [Acuticoccus kandeliae]
MKRALLIVALGLSSLPAQAADLVVSGVPTTVEERASDREWSFGIAPYFWGAGLSGDIAQFGLPAISVDASFSDIWDSLDFGAMAVTEFRFRRFGVFTDLVYVKLSGAKATEESILADSVSLNTQTLTFTIAPEYRAIETDKASLDVMAGARVWSVDTDLRFRGGVLDGVSANDGDTWVDPLIGIKGRYDFTDRFFVTGWGMIGGFGVSSEFMWDAWGGLGYQISNNFSAVVGYRGMGVDYKDDGFKYDIIEHGPVIGGILRF